MKIGEFFLKLFSADGSVSSKRFFGGLLILTAIAGTIIAVVQGELSPVVESLIKTDLFAGVGLLGANIPENIMTVVKREKPVVVKDDEDK